MLSYVKILECTHHNVPSTSKMIPFNLGTSRPCVVLGFKGANRLGFRFLNVSDDDVGPVDIALEPGSSDAADLQFQNPCVSRRLEGY